jgi:hypothetical protein
MYGHKKTIKKTKIVKVNLNGIGFGGFDFPLCLMFHECKIMKL